jgi:phosphate starvation-inducible protein PhoH
MPKKVLSEEEREKRTRRKRKIVKYNFELKHIEPKGKNQENAFHAYFGGSHVLLHGVAGTGKTYISMYFALCEMMAGRVDNIVIVRSTVQTRDLGFMPGNEDEKLAYYEQPYVEICSDLLGRKDAYEKLKSMDVVKFMSTAFIRGLTLDNSVIIIDEVQNMSDHEINSVLTRLGEGSRLLICGDFRQNDLSNSRSRQESGIFRLLEIAKRMKKFSLIEFQVSDIVRSGFVKEYIMHRTELGYDKC